MTPIDQPKNDLLENLDNCICEIYYFLNIHLEIYRKSEERTKKFNDFDGTISTTLYNLLFEKITLGICKLLDPAQSFGHKNISLAAILIESRNNIQESTFEKLSKDLRSISESSKKLKDLRDKIFAHNSFEFYVQKIRFEGAPEKQVFEILDSISVWMNILQNEARNTTTLYKEGIYYLDGQWFEKMLDWALEGKNKLEKASKGIRMNGPFLKKTYDCFQHASIRCRFR